MNDIQHLTRREFLTLTGAAALSAAVGEAPVSSAAPPVAEYRRGGMTYRRLGGTDLQVSLLAMGSHTNPADRVPAGPNRTRLTEAGQARRHRPTRAAPTTQEVRSQKSEGGRRKAEVTQRDPGGFIPPVSEFLSYQKPPENEIPAGLS